MESLGSRIAFLIKKKQVSQETAAAGIGTTVASLNRIINDKQEPRAGTLVGIAKYFGVSIDWIASGVDPGVLQKVSQDVALRGDRNNVSQVVGPGSVSQGSGDRAARQEIGSPDLEISEKISKLTATQKSHIIALINSFIEEVQK